MEPVKIAVIGAGASGTITTIQLLQKLNVPAEIYLIEKRKEATCLGTAYSSPLPYEPLNVQTGRMSIFNHLPDDFFNWLKANKQSGSKTEITTDCFVSRRWFGEYLQQHFSAAQKAAPHIRVHIVNTFCKDVDYSETEESYTVWFDTADYVYADYLVFATGNETPADIFSQEQVQLLAEKYVSNPWHTNPFTNLQSTDDVLFVGTGLTMIDHVVSLQKQNHQGKIFCFSRNGYLPLPHTYIQAFTFETDGEARGVQFAFASLRNNIKKASSKKVEWQNVIDAMRPYTTKFWRSMTTDSKKEFLKRLRPYWEIHRHRMPNASANSITTMQQSGQLKIVGGKFGRLALKDNRVEFCYASKAGKSNQQFLVDRIINCTGPSNDYYQTSNTLFKNLLQKGWMQQDELKLGIVTGARGEIIKANGVVLHNAFGVGPVRKASEWESTAIREIRTHAENVAISIAAPAEKKFDMTAEIGL